MSQNCNKKCKFITVKKTKTRALHAYARRARYCFTNSVCLSVCPSVRLCKTNGHFVTLFDALVGASFTEFKLDPFGGQFFLSEIWHWARRCVVNDEQARLSYCDVKLSSKLLNICQQFTSPQVLRVMQTDYVSSGLNNTSDLVQAWNCDGQQDALWEMFSLFQQAF